MKTAIIIIIAVLILGGGIWWFTQSDTTDTTNTNTTANTNTTDSMKSVAEIMATGDSMKCVFTLDDSNGEQMWTMYVDGERVRGDYEVTPTDGDAWEGHIITDSEWHYNWGNYNGTVYGTKMKIAEYESGEVTDTESQPQGATDISYDQNVEMDCSDWNVDESKFEAPSDVTFTDLSAQMEQMESMSGDVNAAACAACDASSDPASCKAALGCS